jgi:TPR repeat protein
VIKSAEQNQAKAQSSLGLCYYSGNGVAKAAVESAKWYRTAAEQNLADAELGLGNCYRAQDDARYFQISVPVQPGNSGGALVDERGNVVGVVSAKLSARAALDASGALPENVNYAVKSSFLLGFLESVPDVSAKLKKPYTTERKFEEVIKSAEQAAVLVLMY